MDIKDIVLSTLAEIETDVENEKKQEQSLKGEEIEEQNQVEQSNHKSEEESLSEEKIFLQSLRERVLVLFEGLQSPNNDNIETKLDITLNFLEFLLASTEKRLQKLP